MTELDKYYSGRKVLVTGGLGFIGSSLARALVGLGARVTVLDAMIEGYGGNRFNVDGIEDRIDVVIGDQRDRRLLERLLPPQEFIFNLAGTLSHIDSIRDPVTDLEINCLAQLNLLEACRAVNPSVRVVFAGTRGEYGRPSSLPVREDDPLSPIDINGIHNVAAEGYHRLYHRLHGLPATTLRLTNTYGPRHQMRHSRQGIINWFIRQAMDGETIRLFGGGRQVRDATYITDAVEAFLRAGAEPSTIGGSYNLGGAALQLREIAGMIIREAGRGSVVDVPFPDDYLPIEVGDYAADTAKFTAATGWTQCVDPGCGIRMTIEFYAKFRERYW